MSWSIKINYETDEGISMQASRLAMHFEDPFKILQDMREALKIEGYAIDSVSIRNRRMTNGTHGRTGATGWVCIDPNGLQGTTRSTGYATS